MSENIPITTEVDSVLRAWAHAQAPDRNFDADRVYFFVQSVQHREGAFFVPGELVLGHPVEGEAAEQATGRGRPVPLAVWSFALGREIVVPQALVRPDRPAGEAPHVEAPADAK